MSHQHGSREVAKKFLNLQNKHKDLKEQHESLQHQHNDLKKEHARLQVQLLSHHQQLQQLQHSTQQLQAQQQQLQSLKLELESLQQEKEQQAEEQEQLRRELQRDLYGLQDEILLERERAKGYLQLLEQKEELIQEFENDREAHAHAVWLEHQVCAHVGVVGVWIAYLVLFVLQNLLAEKEEKIVLLKNELSKAKGDLDKLQYDIIHKVCTKSVKGRRGQELHLCLC